MPAIKLSSIAAAPGGFVINGHSAGDLSGFSVGVADDIHGDGLADLIVGAPGGEPVAGSAAGRLPTANSQATDLWVYLTLAQSTLRQFLLNPGFDDDIHQVFGNGVDPLRARMLVQGFAEPDFISWPRLEIRPETEINRAQGAYAAATDTIYLAREFLTENTDKPEAITSVLLEELGHALDARLNAADTPGDEGELFSALARNQALTASDLQRIRAEDDRVALSLDSQSVLLEQSTTNLGSRQGYGYLTDFIYYGDPSDNWNFSTVLPGGSGDYVRVSSSSTYVDLVLRLYNQNGAFIEADYDQNPTDGNLESISLANVPAGTYRATVFDYYSGNYLGSSNAYYTLAINAPQIPKDRFEGASGNDTLPTATPVNSGASLAGIGYYFSDLSIDRPGSTTGDVDVFKLTTTRVATDADCILSLVTGNGDIDLELDDSSGNIIYTTYWDATGYGWNAIPLAGLQPGTYYLRAGSYEGNVTPSYDLVFALPQAPTTDHYDASASNNTLNTATNLGTVSGFRQETDLSIDRASDVDWFKFKLSGQGSNQNYLQIDFDGLQGDLDIELYNSANQLIDYSDGIEGAEAIALSGLTAGTYYYLKVYGYNQSASDYSLTINAPGTNNNIRTDSFDSVASNNTRAAATNLGAPQYGWPQGAGFHAWENLSITSGDQDWFKFNLNGTGSYGNYVAATFDTTKGDLDLELYRESGTTPVLQSTGFRDMERIDLNGLTQGTYYIHVAGYQGATNPDYTLAINAPGSDSYEDNDSQADAKTLTRATAQQTWTNLSIDDADWFKFSLPSKGTSNDFVRIDFSHALGDLDLKLCNSAGNTLHTSSGVGDHEQISLDGLNPGDYKIQVYGYNNAKNPAYSLTIAAPVANSQDWAEPNNDRTQATELNSLTHPGSDLVQLGIDAARPLSINSQADVDWFKFTLATAGRSGDFAQLSLDHTAGDLDLYLYDASNQLIGKSEGVANLHAIDLKDLAAGTYYLEVKGYNGATNSAYALAVQAPFTQTGCDLAEGNNDAVHAKDLGAVSSPYSQGKLSIQASDVDWFKFHIGATGESGDTVGISFNHGQGDLDIALYAADKTTLLDSSTGVTGLESISLNGKTAGDYYLKVYGYQEAANPDYTLFIDPPKNTQGDWAEGISGNNTVASAYNLRNVEGLQTWDPLSLHQTSDVDWFKFTTLKKADASDFVRIQFDQTQGDLDLYLYDSTGATLLGKAETTDNVEQIKLTDASGASLAAGSYLVKVAGYHGAANPSYQLSINAPDNNPADWAEGNDTRAAAKALQTVEGTQAFSGLSLDHAGDVDWFSFSTVGMGGPGHSVSIQFDHTQGDLQLQLFDKNGVKLGESLSDSDREAISLENLPTDPYFVKIYGATGSTTSPSYSLDFDAPQTPKPDFAEGDHGNDTRQNAYDLRSVSGTLQVGGLSISPAGDQDWFKFTLDKDATAGDKVRIDFDKWEGDLSLELYDASGSRLASSTTSENFEEISLAVKAKGTYFAKITGNNETTNPEYNLTVTGTSTPTSDAAEDNNRPINAYDLRSATDMGAASSQTRFFPPYTYSPGWTGLLSQIPALNLSAQHSYQQAFNAANYNANWYSVGHNSPYSPALGSQFFGLLSSADSLGGLGGATNHISSSGGYGNYGSPSDIILPTSSYWNTYLPSPSNYGGYGNYSLGSVTPTSYGGYGNYTLGSVNPTSYGGYGNYTLGSVTPTSYGGYGN